MWNAQDAQKATGGKSKTDWKANGVTIDSRNIQPGQLFVALKGERYDGHEFVREALAKGAAAAVVSQVPTGLQTNAPLLIVKDTFKALQALGQFARNRTDAKIIAVTGSVGKTSTKEALRMALAASGETYATTGNLNNHIGVPLSLANLSPDAKFAVFELGMNHSGEIHELTRQVKPHVALITTIEAVHLEFFDSLEDIADAKAEIFDGMDKNGIAVLNADNAQYDRLEAKARKAGISHIVAFGTKEQAQSQLRDYRAGHFGCEVVATVNGTSLTYTLGAIGRHLAMMSVAVLAAADMAGADLALAASALANFREPKGRGAIKLVKVNGIEMTLVDDSYNASPASMQAAFQKLHDLRQAATQPCRTVAVLGDMLELGPRSAEMHKALITPLLNNHIDLVFTAGTFMKHLYDALPESMRGAYAKSSEELAPKVVSSLKPRDIVLVKGSRGSRMDKVSDAIEKSKTPQQEDMDAV